MAFFRKWKLNTKHKKLTEEWALATSLKDFSESQDEEDQENITAFDLKYLGNTCVNSEKNETTTIEAIKSVTTTAKSTRRKSQRVNVNISPRGIEVLDSASSDTLLRVSIYKISYCSAVATHPQVFAFIGSESEASSNQAEDSDEKLSCYVFLCPKRKIAHDVTLTVARCFETAYQIWRHSVERKKYQDEIRNRCNKEQKQIQVIKDKKEENDVDSVRDLLIDLSPEIRTDFFETDHRDYLQNTWVSFEDDIGKDVGRICQAPWGQQIVC